LSHVLVLFLCLEVQIIFLVTMLVSPKLGGSHIHSNFNVFSTFVACLGNGGIQELKPFVIIQNIWSKTTFITNIGGILSVLSFDDSFQIVVHFCAHTQSFLEGFCSSGQDHKLLHSKLVTGMGATIDDIEGRNRQNDFFLPSKVCKMSIERHSFVSCTCFAHCKGDC